MQAPHQSLNQVIKSAAQSSNLPLALPLVHMSIARWFRSIVDKGNLEPRMCDIFGEELIYCFYGGVFYRTGNTPTRNASELPVAFLFDPSVLRTVSRYYPFDTGALATGRFGEIANQLQPFKEKFKVCGDDDYTVPCKIVHSIYGTNAKYLQGKIDSECRNKPDPLPQLYSFISSDLSGLGIDHRQCIIECQINVPISLRHQLLWVGFPEIMTETFARLYELTKPSMPDYYAYPSHVIFTPSEIAAQLQMRAYEVVKRFEQFPKGS